MLRASHIGHGAYGPAAFQGDGAAVPVSGVAAAGTLQLQLSVRSYIPTSLQAYGSAAF